MDIYRNINDMLIDGSIKAFMEEPVTLFGDNLPEFLDGFRKLHTGQAYDLVLMSKFGAVILRTVYASGDKVAIHNEANALRGFYRCIGSYISDRNRKGDFFNHQQWENIISDTALCTDKGIDEKLINDYYRDYYYIVFDLIYGLFKCGYNQLIEDGFINRFLIKCTTFFRGQELQKLRWQSFNIFAVYGYLYYVFKYGEKCGANSEEIEGAKKLLYCKSTQKNLNDYVRRCASVYSSNKNGECYECVFSKDYATNMSVFLRNYEIFKKEFDAHLFYTDKAAREFYLFIITHISYTCGRDELLEKGIDTEEYKIYIQDNNIQYTKNVFTTLIPMFETFITKKKSQSRKLSSSSDEMVQMNTSVEAEEVQGGNSSNHMSKERHTKVQRANVLFEYFYQWMVKKCTKSEIEKAQQEQKEYKETINEDELKQQISEVIDEAIRDKYALIMKTNCIASPIDTIVQNVNLLTFNNFTSSMGISEVREAYIEIPVNVLSDWIIIILYNNHLLELRDKSKLFATDKDYIEYLKKNITVLMGSDYLINKIDPENIEVFQDTINDIKKIYTTSDYGLLLRENALSVDIDNIQVTINSPSRSDILETAQRTDDNSYIYEVSQGLNLTFTEDELIKYVSSKRKTITVTAKLIIKIYEDDIGLAIKECFY